MQKQQPLPSHQVLRSAWFFFFSKTHVEGPKQLDIYQEVVNRELSALQGIHKYEGVWNPGVWSLEMKSKDVEVVRLWEHCKNSPGVSGDDDFVELQRHIGVCVPAKHSHRPSSSTSSLAARRAWERASAGLRPPPCPAWLNILSHQATRLRRAHSPCWSNDNATLCIRSCFWRWMQIQSYIPDVAAGWEGFQKCRQMRCNAT